MSKLPKDNFEGKLTAWLFDHSMTREQLEQIARVARATHAGFKQTRYHQSYPEPSEISEEWLKVAQRAVEQGLPPAEFVSTVWSAHRDVHPNILGSTVISAEVLQARAQREADIRQRVALQSARLRRWRKEDPNRSLQSELVDPRGQFEPLFIYCIAKWQGLTELAKLYETNAKLTLCDAVTARVFAELLPEAFT